MIFHDDCLIFLRNLESDSLDSLVTDPPAGIAFMGKDWDKDRGGRSPWVAWMTDVMRECLRVLKPGAHGLVWALPRTSHWTATALEDAGFEVRDVVTHLFGTGFPKSLDVSKAIDKAAGAEREVVGQIRTHNIKGGALMERKPNEMIDVTAPATDAAKQWQGFGTALKPASEHWVLVRKPLGEKTVAANVLKHGTGAVNIDSSRIAGVPTTFPKPGNYPDSSKIYPRTSDKREAEPNQLGRFPANLLLSHNHDCEQVGTKKVRPGNGSGKAGAGGNGFRTEYVGGEKKAEGFTGGFVNPADGTETVPAWRCTPGCAVAELDGQSGVRAAGEPRTRRKPSPSSHFGSGSDLSVVGQSEGYGDFGGASRFFYCAKASKKDRGEGNTHPTVKSTQLMRYLCRLVTPPGGTVLDPFAGSGSTGVAALAEGFRFVGVEQEAEYAAIAKTRLEAAGGIFG